MRNGGTNEEMSAGREDLLVRGMAVSNSEEGQV